MTLWPGVSPLPLRPSSFRRIAVEERRRARITEADDDAGVWKQRARHRVLRLDDLVGADERREGGARRELLDDHGSGNHESGVIASTTSRLKTTTVRRHRDQLAVAGAVSGGSILDAGWSARRPTVTNDKPAKMHSVPAIQNAEL